MNSGIYPGSRTFFCQLSKTSVFGVKAVTQYYFGTTGQCGMAGRVGRVVRCAGYGCQILAELVGAGDVKMLQVPRNHRCVTHPTLNGCQNPGSPGRGHAIGIYKPVDNGGPLLGWRA